MKNMNEQIKASALDAAKKTERGWERTFLFPADFDGFQGHFLGTPVLPAIIQIMAVRQAIAEQMSQQLQVTQIARTKFMKTITPDIAVTLIWNVDRRGDSLKCKCKLETNGETASNITMTLTAKRD